jgi:hypothetical protein
LIHSATFDPQKAYLKISAPESKVLSSNKMIIVKKISAGVAPALGVKGRY